MNPAALHLHEVRGTDAELDQLASLLATMDDEAPLPLACMRERFTEMRRPPRYRCYLMYDAPAGEADNRHARRTLRARRSARSACWYFGDGARRPPPKRLSRPWW